jgi:hypothetical protein
MPNRLASATCRCDAASERAPATGSTGRVPNGRVSWPRPCAMTSAQTTGSLVMSCWCGATPAPEGSAPTQTPTSWASFSSSVIASTSASTRSATGREVSRHAALGRSAAVGTAAPASVVATSVVLFIIDQVPPLTSS